MCANHLVPCLCLVRSPHISAGSHTSVSLHRDTLSPLSRARRRARRRRPLTKAARGEAEGEVASLPPQKGLAHRASRTSGLGTIGGSSRGSPTAEARVPMT